MKNHSQNDPTNAPDNNGKATCIKCKLDYSQKMGRFTDKHYTDFVCNADLENDPFYYWCETCEMYIHVDEMERKNEDGHCPHCDELLEPLNK